MLMVAESAGWQLAWIAILFACRHLLVLVDDVDLVDQRFLGVCWIRANDAGSDLVKYFGISCAVTVGHVVKKFFFTALIQLDLAGNPHAPCRNWIMLDFVVRV